MNSYPFTRCLSPRKILNPYTHDTLVVPCGKCLACKNSKNSRMTLQCELESQSSDAVLFGTLTYSEDNVPLAKMVKVFTCDDDGFGSYHYDIYDCESGEILIDNVELTNDLYDKLSRKYNTDGIIRYLRKKDAQDFLKRLRYYYTDTQNEKIRYFLCGEYGPVHFRPHFHFLLFIRVSDKTRLQQALSNARQAVYKAWKFGRVDVQVSKGKCSSYVASYVNSFSSLPEILRVGSFRQFCVHSQRLGYSFLERQLSEIYETSVEDFIRRSLVIDGKDKEFNVWRSYYSYFYPRCKGYAIKSEYRRSLSYKMYADLRKIFPYAKNPKELAVAVASLFKLFSSSYQVETYYKYKENPHRCYVDLLSMLSEEFPFGVDEYSPMYVRFIDSIYTQILLSRHFLMDICLGSTHCVYRMLGRIDEFYKRLEYLHLVEYFENQQAYFSEDYADEDDITYFQGGDYTLDFLNSPAFQAYKSKIEKLSSERIKHKKLNDINEVLFN